MKREDLIDALEYIDDEYIQEADQTRSAEKSTGGSGNITPFRKRKASVRGWGILAASVAVFAIGAFAISGVIQTRNEAGKATQSAEAVQREEVREGQADTYAPEEQGAAEETEAFAPEEAAEAEDTDAYAQEEPAAIADMAASEEPADETEETAAAAIGSVRIRVISDAGEISFILNDTPAAQSLAAQLPLTADTEPYSDNEIVFHPEEPLAVENGIEGGGTAGCIGYFAPWNNVVLYYGDFEEYPGLYILGEAVSGAENIKDIKGSITIERE